MAIKTGDNFLYRGKKPLDSRDSFDTILAMTTFAESSLDEGHISYVKETDKYYKFNSTNSVDTTLGKWREYKGSGSSTDEKVKLDANATDAKYLNELIDNSTIEIDNDNGVIVVKKIEGQTATVAEINFLTGIKSNIQKQLDNLGKSMTMYGVFNTKADLIASTTPTPVDGNTAIVIADEDNNNKQMTYIYIASNAAWTQVAENSIKVRNFSTDPINLATETTGTLQKEKIDVAIARLVDVLDKTTYKGSDNGIVKQADKLTGLTYTIEALNKAIQDSHKHNNKTLLDSIVSNGIGDRFLADDGNYISILHIGTTVPLYDSQIWIDTTDTDNPKLKINDGLDWIAISGSGGGTSGATLSKNITSNVEVGGVASGKIFAKGTKLETILENILVKYLAPTVSLSISPATTVYKKGSSISSVTMTANVTKKSNPIASVEFYVGGTLVDTQTGATGGTFTYTHTTAITADTTFKVIVRDGTSSPEASKSVVFVNPYYYGASSSATVTDTTGLSELVETKGNKTKAYTLSNEYAVFMYPASYGNLKSILDPNNFENLADFNKSTVTIGSVSYNVYVSKNPITCTNFNYTFKY